MSTDWLNVSEAEVKLIASSWQIMSQNFDKHSTGLYILFLSDFPEHRKYFKIFDDVADLKDHPVVKKHGLKVMTEITALLQKAGDQEAVIKILERTAKVHKKFNIGNQAFDDLRSTIVKLVCNEIGEAKATPELKNAWNNALQVMFQVVLDKLEILNSQ